MVEIVDVILKILMRGSQTSPIFGNEIQIHLFKDLNMLLNSFTSA